MSANWVGMDKSFAYFTETMVRAEAGAASLVTTSAHLVEKAAKANFDGSHKKGEPHEGGDKPNVVSGDLRRSIVVTRTTRTAFGEFSATVGPTMIYGRRVELGYGSISRAFPYFEPGAETAHLGFGALAMRTWMTVRGR